MAEEVKQPYAGAKNEDFEKIQEWLYMCLAKWYWFVIALAIALGLAILYLLNLLIIQSIPVTMIGDRITNITNAAK